MKPHKHAELIKAWADGAEIECRGNDGNWFVAENPGWNPDREYRIKPMMRKYRVAQMFDKSSNQHYTTTADSEIDAHSLHSANTFVHWLTDWVEYETNT